MTGTGNSGKPRPAGLGGWLWPVTLAAAVLPVLLTTSFVASVLSFIEFLRQEWSSPQPELAWAYRAISLHLLLVLFPWWWALRWFARDPQMLFLLPAVRRRFRGTSGGSPPFRA